MSIKNRVERLERTVQPEAVCPGFHQLIKIPAKPGERPRPAVVCSACGQRFGVEVYRMEGPEEEE